MSDGLVYVEYLRRLPGVALDEFHATMAAAQTAWDEGHGEDVLLWAGARTWRLGPEPEYITVWHSPGQLGLGLGRIDDWDTIFRAGERERHAQTVGRVARIERAGCYQALREPVAARNGTYYVEFFRATGTMPVVRSFYEARVRRFPQLALNLLAQRIGRLAPDPGGIALWTVPSFASLEQIAADLDRTEEPVALVAAGTYTDVGQEIL